LEGWDRPNSAVDLGRKRRPRRATRPGGAVIFAGGCRRQHHYAVSGAATASREAGDGGSAAGGSGEDLPITQRIGSSPKELVKQKSGVSYDVVHKVPKRFAVFIISLDMVNLMQRQNDWHFVSAKIVKRCFFIPCYVLILVVGYKRIFADGVEL
jgi:hypothetical protein